MNSEQLSVSSMRVENIKIAASSPEKTFDLGKIIGQNLKSGMVIALTGGLGSGKTTFVQGLARGLDVPETYYITSPTYTLINEYPGRYTLFHIDLYRLEGNVDFEDIGLYEVLQGQGVAAIEWSERLHKNALENYLLVNLKISGDQSRNIKISAYGLEENNLICELDKIIKGQEQTEIS